MNIEHENNSINLTSSEIGYLWSTYILNSKSKYIIKYIVEKTIDKDIKLVMKKSFDLSNKIIIGIENIYRSAGHVIPHAFSEEDINLQADNLFSDTLWLAILKSFTTFGLSSYGSIMPKVARSDVKKLFTDALNETIVLSNNIDEIALNKGIFVRSPYIPIPKKVEFAKDKGIMGSFLAAKRPLDALEIGNVFNASNAVAIAESILAGLSQIVDNKKIKDHMKNGKKMLKEHKKTLDEILTKEELNIADLYNNHIQNTTTSPFSDRISLYFSISTTTDLINAYSFSQLSIIRKDIYLKFTQLSSELVLYLKEGTDILIDSGWLEEVPKNIQTNKK